MTRPSPISERCATSRVAKAVLISTIPPLMLKTGANPDGTPIDAIRTNTRDNGAQFFRELSLPFYGYNRPGANVSEAVS